jgi:hypothetical protein
MIPDWYRHAVNTLINAAFRGPTTTISPMFHVKHDTDPTRNAPTPDRLEVAHG